MHYSTVHSQSDREGRVWPVVEIDSTIILFIRGTLHAPPTLYTTQTESLDIAS